MPAHPRPTLALTLSRAAPQVESLRGFGGANSETLAELVWAFFEYWAWRHNYSSDVVSIRLGACLHKDDKDWTRRIGNERHLVGRGGVQGGWVGGDGSPVSAPPTAPAQKHAHRASKTPPPWHAPYPRQVCIEDPFELSHDLGRTVDRQTRAVLHKEFTRAATLLRDADDPLDALFAPYRVGHRG